MPNRSSWNGGWSGSDKEYVIIKTFISKKDIRKAGRILSEAPYYYSWSDGWGARIDVIELDSTESRRVRRKSDGFCGYDWMVKTICEYGKILADHEIKTAGLLPKD